VIWKSFCVAAIALTFTVDGGRRSGTAVMPEGDGPFPFVILVHGDGAATRFLDDALLPFGELLRTALMLLLVPVLIAISEDIKNGFKSKDSSFSTLKKKETR